MGLSPSLNDLFWLSVYENAGSDAWRFTQRLSQDALNAVEGMASSAVQSVTDPLAYYSNQIESIANGAATAYKLATDRCARKNAVNELQSYLSNPEAYADFTLFAELFVAGGGEPEVESSELTGAGQLTEAGAGQVAEAADTSAIKGGCFVAGTLVAVESGFKEIQDIKPGEKVWSFELSVSQWQLKPAEKTSVKRYEGDVITIEAGGESVEATGNHPIWVIDGTHLDSRPALTSFQVPAPEQSSSSMGRWVQARFVKAGDTLLSRTGQFVQVDEITTRAAKLSVYNLQIEGYHTYAVSRNALLVHNNSILGDPLGGGGGDAGGGSAASPPVQVPARTSSGTGGPGNVAGGNTTVENALTQAEVWLGPGYEEIAPGVYRSADDLRQFRMTTSDLTDPIQGPHVHFESIGPDGRTIIENSHVGLTNP